MPDNDTLLAYLVSSFPGNTENIATEALRHIFSHSDASIEALNDVVQSGVRGVAPIAKVNSQVVRSDGTIPDLVGFDEDGKERVLIEVKFWAELTANQPSGYVNRLPDGGLGVVIFLAPEERIQSLWPQLRRRLEQQAGTLEELDSERKCVRVFNTQRHLMIVSWGSLLDSMAARNREYEEQGVETEIRQLRSLAKYADNGALKPISDGTEAANDSDRLLRTYRRLIDAATERGISQEWVDRKGLRATPRSYGYGRYIRLHGAVVWFGVNAVQFEKTGETPLWVNPGSALRDLRAEIADKLDVQESGWFPVTLKRGVEYPEMLEGVVDSLKHIADAIHETCLPPARVEQGSAHGEPLEPIIERVDGTLLFPDGSEGRPGLLTEAQQRQVDIQNASRRFGQTRDDSGLIRLGIFSDKGEE